MSAPNLVAAQAAANALAGERTHQTFSYPITGDPEADLISAILSVVNSIPGRRGGSEARVCRYLAERFEREDKDRAEMMRAYQAQAQNTAPMMGQPLGGMGGMGGSSAAQGPWATMASAQAQFNQSAMTQNQAAASPGLLGKLFGQKLSDDGK